MWLIVLVFENYLLVDGRVLFYTPYPFVPLERYHPPEALVRVDSSASCLHKFFKVCLHLLGVVEDGFLVVVDGVV